MIRKLLLKVVDRENLTIILVSDEVSLPLIRKVRREGIFFHALKQDKDEIREAVQCAFENLNQLQANHKW